MLLGVPIFGVIYYLVTKGVNNILRKKELVVDTTAYIEAVKVDEGTNSLVYQKLSKEKGDGKPSKKKMNKNFFGNKVKKSDSEKK